MLPAESVCSAAILKLAGSLGAEEEGVMTTWPMESRTARGEEDFVSFSVRYADPEASLFGLLQYVLQFSRTTLCQFWHTTEACRKDGSRAAINCRISSGLNQDRRAAESTACRQCPRSQMRYTE